jgi:hypothetical protein
MFMVFSEDKVIRNKSVLSKNIISCLPSNHPELCKEESGQWWGALKNFKIQITPCSFSMNNMVPHAKP